ncbi:MAG: class III cytochrome C [Desulfobacterales bacterium SG8_35_2]|nr:MAG: class III cytochrome C [Desulfobacterales bacterium SG8_35_2]
MKKSLFLIVSLVFVIGFAFAETGVKKRRPLPYEYGEVVINNYSKGTQVSPVVFDHWLHRAKFTCRLCHVDIGFAMKAGETDIRAADNINGYYCGSCHNGKTAFFSCNNDYSIKHSDTCDRCHSFGKAVVKKYNFNEFVKEWPRERFGNGLDWEKAEQQGMISPVDFLEGVSIKREKLTDQNDFELGAKYEGMPDIIFSHQKHTVWNGCELCHPEIFIGIKKGLTKYSMEDIFAGKYCGVCHSSVAFPLLDCQRCHTEKIQ